MENLRRGLITAFCCLHVAALVWWTTPSNGYPKDSRSAELPEWYTNLEQPTFEWKKASLGTPWARVLDRYIFTTASWQSWWLFAPNPMQVHDWVTIKAVLAWKDPDPSIPKDERKIQVWGDAREPIYDEKPIYTSYEGELKARMLGTAGWYTHDSKLIENLASGNWDRPLGAFVEYWGRVYKEQTGKKPVGMHVILTRGHIPVPFSGRMPASDEPSERILWYLHY